MTQGGMACFESERNFTRISAEFVGPLVEQSARHRAGVEVGNGKAANDA